MRFHTRSTAKSSRTRAGFRDYTQAPAPRTPTWRSVLLSSLFLANLFVRVCDTTHNFYDKMCFLCWPLFEEGGVWFSPPLHLNAGNLDALLQDVAPLS